MPLFLHGLNAPFRALELTQAAGRRDRLAKGGKRAGELQGGLRVLHPGD